MTATDNKAPTPRKLRPRAPVAVAPVTISQLNSTAVVGVDPRRFLELLGRHPELPRVRVGKLALVDASDWLDWVHTHAQNDTGDAAADPDADDGVPRTADGVLARLGFERAA